MDQRELLVLQAQTRDRLSRTTLAGLKRVIENSQGKLNMIQLIAIAESETFPIEETCTLILELLQQYGQP